MSTMVSEEELNLKLEQDSNNTNKPFLIDRSCIPTVPQDEQNGELYDLGIDIYEQEALEKEILHQVGEALEKQKGKENEVRLSSEKGADKELKNDNSSSEHVTEEKRDNEKPHCKVDFANCELAESEMGRRVRMGEMTPFGTCISFSNPEINCFGKVEKYLKEQIEAERRRKELKRKLSVPVEKVKVKILETVKKKQCPAVKRVSSSKKKKKQSAIGTYISEEISDQVKKPGKSLAEITPLEESSGSEYNPSESDCSEVEDDVKVPTLKKKKRNAQKEKDFEDKEWNTDDSNWEYSDDEKQKRKSKSAKKEQDDGDMDFYLKRLSIWEKNNNRCDIETQVKTLDEGFSVPLVIWNRLFNYQKVGVQWLWELHVQRCGGILGDEMGLGKTVQVTAFLSGLSVSKLISRHGSFKGLGPVLIVCPTTIMHQWIKELHYWWPQFRVALMHESGNFTGMRSKLIHDIIKTKGILVTSYVSCVQQIDNLTKYLWHYVILDEGHKIRNPDSQIANAAKRLRTPHRLILSGSPMQNNLKELWSLFDFIFPGKLGTLPVFMSEFAVPITQGGYANASQVQVATAFKCATVLRDTISPYLLRRVKDDVKNHISLPLKNEQVLFCKLTEEQRNLYLEYLNSNEVDSILSGRYKIFVGLINLRKICNHPHLYSGGPKLFKWDKPESIPEEERYGYWKKAGKMIVVETLLKIWKKQEHRVLIFTQSKQMLHILESFVQNQGYEYLKLDGSTCIGSRQPIIHKFNEEKKYFVFLSTTRVGGLGINLTGADRVVIYDPDWNPATDTQARERAWRIGQTNQVTIYRLVTSGTIEEKIYHRQIFKQFLTNKVLKDPRQRRFFKSNDLYELFTLKDTDSGITETSALFAGSGSEVNLKHVSRRIKSRQKLLSKAIEIKKKSDPSSILGKEKIEKMKKLAKILSQKISNGTISSSKPSDICENKEITNSLSVESKESNGREKEGECEKDEKHEQKKKKEKKKKKYCFDTFEGETVPHLMSKLEHEECSQLRNDHQKDQDDYILGKLFSKSGIKTALQHDRIMEEGPADYALVEGEAEKVAKEAVKALKESRKQYFQSLDSAVTVTRPRFGAKAKKKIGERSLNSAGSDENMNKTMRSSELLLRMKERNRLLNDNVNNIVTDHSDEQLELLTDIRNFISFEAGVNNMATTQEIIDRFKDRLPAGTSPLIRALLLEICEFHRDSEGKGIWRLRPDFRW